MKTGDKNKIAAILYFYEDIDLINKIFGSMIDYLLYCEVHQEELGLNIKKESLFLYVDDNIDKYLKEENGNAKSLS